MVYLSKEESELAIRFIINTYTRKVLERDLLKFKNSKELKFPGIYVNLLEKSLWNLSDEMHELKKIMRQKKMKIMFKEHKTEYEIWCRGYVEHVSYNNAIIRKAVKDNINRLFKLD